MTTRTHQTDNDYWAVDPRSAVDPESVWSRRGIIDHARTSLPEKIAARERRLRRYRERLDAAVERQVALDELDRSRLRQEYRRLDEQRERLLWEEQRERKLAEARAGGQDIGAWRR